VTAPTQTAGINTPMTASSPSDAAFLAEVDANRQRLGAVTNRPRQEGTS
jgi:hypothetical protein